MPPRPDTRTIADTHARNRDTHRRFADKAKSGIRIDYLSKEDRKVFDALLGPDYRLDTILPACHGGLRYHFFSSLYSRVLEAVKLQEGKNNLVHVTMLHNAWCTGDRITSADLESLERKAQRGLRPWLPNYVAAIETDVFRNVNFKGEDGRNCGRLMCFHVHAFGWGEGLDHRTIEKDLIPRFVAPIPTLGSQKNGVKSVLVQPVTPSEVDVAWILQYPFKSPYEAMSLYRSADLTRAYVNNSEKSDRLVISTRLMEVLSMIELPQLVFARGEGVGINRGAVAELRKWANSQLGCIVPGLSSQEHVRAYWARIKQLQGLERFGTPIIKV